jgi:hypothetical protein
VAKFAAHPLDIDRETELLNWVEALGRYSQLLKVPSTRQKLPTLDGRKLTKRKLRRRDFGS